MTSTRAVSGLLGLGDRLRQLEPAAPFLERRAVAAGKHLEEPPRNRRPRPPRIAPHEDVRVDRLRRVVHHHRPRRRRRMRRIELLDRTVQLLEPAALALIEDEPHPVRC